MTNPSNNLYLATRARLLGGLIGFAGIAVGCIALAAVISLFADASSNPWLADKPENVALMKRCELVAGTAARRACAEAVVAGVQARDAVMRLAQTQNASHAER
jgi:Mg2+/Co2+ transporter CorB